MKLYDLSYSYFSHFCLNFKGFLVSKSQKLLVFVGLNRGPRCSRPKGCYTTILTFFLYFSLVCRLIHPYRLSNNLRSDIIEIYKFQNIQVEPRWRGFSLCPHYTISFGFAKLSRQQRLDRGPSGRFRSVGLPTLSKTIKKQRLNARGARPCLFFVFICSRRRTLNLQTHCLTGVARRGVRRYALHNDL